MLTRSFLPAPVRASILAYSPMLHARLFADTQRYRDTSFQATTRPADDDDSRPAAPYLDGNPALDRPLIVQFCANDPAALLAAAELVAPHCDAVDLNLGCPQGIARKGHYGAFLQEDQDLIFALVNALHRQLPVPVTAKFRILDTREATLAYARNLLRAGASILAVHGRRREQKGHNTGLAHWPTIRYLRDHLPPDTVLFANGNVLQPADLQRCLDATGADGVMSAEANLSDPALFAPAPEPSSSSSREYWRGRDGRGGWRVDAVVRRYFDILHRYVLGAEPPRRRPLFVPGDSTEWLDDGGDGDTAACDEEEPARKKRKRGGGGGDDGATADKKLLASPNITAVQPHLFHLLRHLVARHHDVRDGLARARAGDMAGFERILDAIERKVARGLLEYERTGGASVEEEEEKEEEPKGAEADTRAADEGGDLDDAESSAHAVRRCRRPWWVAQPIVRPLPKEALAKGALQLSKKEKLKLLEEEEAKARSRAADADGAAVEGDAVPPEQSNTTIASSSSGAVSG